MAEAVVSVALETIRNLLLEEIKFLNGVRSQVKGLESQLKDMQCLLQDADRRQHESKSVRNWIKEIRNLAYRAEDVVETYAVEVSSRREKGFRKLIKRFSCVWNESITLHQIGSEISDIKSEIERVYKNMQGYGVKEIIKGESSVSASNENQQWKRQTFPFEIEDCFVGKEDDVKRFISLIVEDKQHRVISIWGMGGLGKTTIARKVYNHFETKRSFESFAWICITQQCQIRSVLEDVLKQLIPQQREEILNMSYNELVRQLREVQKVKRCLIVLDDLWEIDHWNALKQAFLDTELNNKILLTTRKEKIAAVGFHHKLGFLNVDDGWELLKKKAVPEFTVEEELLQRIGKEMVQKCGCLPLGISLLGGILSQKKSFMEWELVNTNIKTHLYSSGGIEEDNEISGVIDLSYEDLPFYLKPCFLYMGHYTEDEIISVKKLCKLWIAEGMISHENEGREKSLMDVAELYLRELVSRCIVQVVDLSGDKIIRSCKLHDIVRELCLSKGKNEDFRLEVMNYGGGKLSALDPSFLGKTRYLVINLTGQEDIKLKDVFTSFNDEINTHNIRSLQFLKRDRLSFEFSSNIVDFWKLRLLRVLVFEKCRFEGGKLPKEIGNLIYLRHLRLRYCRLDELPFSISNLTNLYTLDLNGTRDVQIPNVLNKMLRLKHLYFPYYSKGKIGDYRLSLEGLEELETLNGLSSLVHDLKSISKVKNLRELDGEIYDNKTLSEIINHINTNKTLSWCKLEINEGCELTSTEEGLAVLKKVFACSTLHSLWIRVPIRKLPEYDQCGIQLIFPRLMTLCLENCEIEDDPMEILEKLHFLENLRLLRRSYVGEVMICHAMGFPKLKTLKLMDLSNLREWRVEQGAMPSLNKLGIGSCEHLKLIPDGLKFITTLQELKITGIPELKKRVSAKLDDGGEGEDYHKVRHVPSILCH